MIVLIVHETFKALILLRYKTIKGCCMANFEPLKRRGEQKLLPRRDRGHLLFFPNKQGKSTVFSQVNKVFNQGNALKRLKTLGRAVSVIEMASPFQLVSAAGSLLDPQVDSKRGAFVFVPPN